MNIAKQLIAARKEMNLTQKELADKIGLPASAIARWESGKFNPSTKNLEKLAEALSKDFKYFYTAPAGAVGAGDGPKTYEVKDAPSFYTAADSFPLSGIIKRGEVIFFENSVPAGKFSLSVRDASLSPDFEETDTLDITEDNNIGLNNNKYFLVDIKGSQYIYRCLQSSDAVSLSGGKERKSLPVSEVKIIGRVIAVKKQI
ncbi:helix-turn-helix protein [Parelusimicrobium proximum]|uniref:helix-turn-helix domain-containing protein n=1 Tax=Parelusimicrobium proximum TaxID=3228953 RepID=UPI003D17EEFF